MGQQANSGRHAELDDKKSRSAGREQNAVQKEILGRTDEQFARGKTGGAHGKNDMAERGGGAYTGGAGGGGGAQSRTHAASTDSADNVGRSKRPARKQ